MEEGLHVRGSVPYADDFRRSRKLRILEKGIDGLCHIFRSFAIILHVDRTDQDQSFPLRKGQFLAATVFVPRHENFRVDRVGDIYHFLVS